MSILIDKNAVSFIMKKEKTKHLCPLRSLCTGSPMDCQEGTGGIAPAMTGRAGNR